MAFAISLIAVVIGPSAVAEIPPGEETVALEAAATEIVAEAEAIDPNRQYGIEITNLFLTANGHMIDFRYRVLDAEKAAALFIRQIKPRLIHQKTGKVLSVPETAKLGPLRNSNTPQEGKIYWMFFGNAGNLVKSGDSVTITIGEFRVEDLVVK